MYTTDINLPTLALVKSNMRWPAGIVQGDVHGRQAVLVGADAGGDHLVARRQYALAQQHRDRLAVRTQFALVVDARFRRHVAAGQRVLRIAFDHGVEFQRRGGTDQALGGGGVLHAGQLHHHAVGALALDDGLGNAQFVDAVAQGGDVLFDRIAGDLLQLAFRQGHDDLVAVDVVGHAGCLRTRCRSRRAWRCPSSAARAFSASSPAARVTMMLLSGRRSTDS